MSPTQQTPARAARTKAKIIVWAVLAAVVFTGIVGFFVTRAAAQPEASAVPAGVGQVVRENSHVLSQAPNEQAVLVEFLDFECESCRAAYPFVEDLRAEYADTVTFVHRYFPLPGHRNSMNAALAVEAAAEQGAYEKMYQRMFETQAQWGESAEDKSVVFRGFAEDLGLDLAAYDHAVGDPSLRSRVELDVADGKALGVTGTPTFYLDGKLLEPGSLEEFTASVDAATGD